jgi:hypothetical protein
MSDNVIKSTDINKQESKPAKKAPAKKAAAVKKPKEEKVAEDVVSDSASPKDGYQIIVFESGSSYVANGIRFTRENHIQEIPVAEANLLLSLENFRLPDQFEVEEYLNSKED